MNTEKTTQLIATKLKNLRAKKGLTQLEVAEKAKISPNYYARIERGEIKTTIEKLEKIAKALDVRSSDILPF
jgi:transcriptional regulator with XRE-family HTH domain